MEKQDEILSVDPTITDTEAETFPAAGIVEEAAETTPQYSWKMALDREMILRNCEVRKKKLGDRITALQQLVSPFRKTDTDSVLLEAIGYIRFQQSQIEVSKNMMRNQHSVHVERNSVFPEDPGQAKEIDFLPLSLKDLANTPLEQKALTWEAFLCFVVGGMLDISPQQYGILLMICIGFLSYYAKNSTTPFDMQFGKTTTTPVQSLISFSEAFYAFFPEITHITKFMLCYVLSWMLVLPLRPGMQIFLVLLLISAPIFYFPELIHKASASGIHVACGSLKLPLIGFATLGAIGLSLICGFMTLLMVYLRWRFIYKGKPRVRAIEVSLDGLSEILQG